MSLKVFRHAVTTSIRLISYWILLGATVLLSLLSSASSHCSEAHRQTCSYPYLQLDHLMSQTAVNRYVPDFNETTLKTACKLFNDYQNCTVPFLPSCNDAAVTELQTFEATLGLICGDLFYGYLKQKSCFRRHYISYNSCKRKEIRALQGIDVTNPAYPFVLCSTARDYSYCIYTSTALGCSLSAADIYFKLLNHSISSIFKMKGSSCNLPHPLDVISAYTTTPSTIPTTKFRTTSVPNDNIRSSPDTQISGSESIRNNYFGLCFIELGVLLHIELIINYYVFR